MANSFRSIGFLIYDFKPSIEEFRNSHGGADAGAGTGSSYLCYSNCDMFKVTL